VPYTQHCLVPRHCCCLQSAAWRPAHEAISVSTGLDLGKECCLRFAIQHFSLYIFFPAPLDKTYQGTKKQDAPEENALLAVACLFVQPLSHGVANCLPLHVGAEVHL